MPPDWRDVFGLLAAAFGWGPRDLYDIPIRELEAWKQQAMKWKGRGDGTR